VDGPGNTTLSLDNMSQLGPRGTRDWAPYVIERVVDPSAANGSAEFFRMKHRLLEWLAACPQSSIASVVAGLNGMRPQQGSHTSIAATRRKPARSGPL
jgi:hypothetical protein